MFKRQDSEPDSEVNQSVRQASMFDITWRWRDLSVFLHSWAEIFNQEFFDGDLPQPAISFERTRRDTLGHFLYGRNDYGLRFNINLNQQHLGRSEADLLETLVHEQTHLYQFTTGKAGLDWRYHNKAFVEKAASIGLQVKQGRGCHTRPAGDPFVALLKEQGVCFEPRVRVTKTQSPERPQEQQRLKRWACHCKAVWCGGTLEAVCQKCSQHFILSPAKAA